jgi:hypothetical protein
MIDFTIVLDEDMPPHAVYLIADGERVTLSVSPKLENAYVLAALHPDMATHVADAINSLGRDDT